jgi:hypothetical protein
MKSEVLYKKNRFIFLAFLSAILSIAIFYFDEGRHNFGFLVDFTEVFNFIILFALVTIIPLAIYLLTGKSKFARSSFFLALIGYIPAIFLLALTWF